MLSTRTFSNKFFIARPAKDDVDCWQTTVQIQQAWFYSYTAVTQVFSNAYLLDILDMITRSSWHVCVVKFVMENSQ